MHEMESKQGCNYHHTNKNYQRQKKIRTSSERLVLTEIHGIKMNHHWIHRYAIIVLLLKEKKGWLCHHELAK